MQAFHKVLNIPESGQIMPHSRVLNKHSQRFTGFLKSLQLLIWPGSEYGKVVNMQGLQRVLNKTSYALIMSQYERICLNNTEYD